MTVEIHLNGSLSVELRPESEIERLVLMKMASGAESGKKVSMEATMGNEVFAVSVEK